MVKIGAAGEGKGMEYIVRGTKILKGAVANSINELIRNKVVEREKRLQNTA